MELCGEEAEQLVEAIEESNKIKSEETNLLSGSIYAPLQDPKDLEVPLFTMTSFM